MSATRVRLLILATVLQLPISASTAGTLLYDDFTGGLLADTVWHIPTWQGPCDGTYVGRTQFRTTQNSPLPKVSESNVRIPVETYNPTGFSFYGTDLVSNQLFSVGQGLNIKVRAKMDVPAQAGTVAGIFLYHLSDTLAQECESDRSHDEIDFELLGNWPDEVATNVYMNEPLGGGNPESYQYASGSVTDYHVYEIRWRPNGVKWLVDGTIVREKTSFVPTGPMAFHLNMWVPDRDWVEAYSDTIQPTPFPWENEAFTMSVDWVIVETPPSAAIQGNVRTVDDIPVCALVLANGQYMFSCDGNGTYSLNVPLDEQGQVTLFAFADGFAPFRVTAAPAKLPGVVRTVTADPDSPLIFMGWDMACAANNWVHLSGEIESEGGEPLCALVLANGQHMFSCGDSNGRYDLTVPVDQNGNITLFGFADGFEPYNEVFIALNCAR